MTNGENTPKTVRCRNPHNGVVYVYTYEVYYDETQGKYRQRRRCVGKVDLVSGDVVPTLPRGSWKKKTVSESPVTSTDSDKGAKGEVSDLLRLIEDLKARIRELEANLTACQRELAQLRTSKERLVKAIESALKKG